MSGDVTYQALDRLTFLADRDSLRNGNVIAGQPYNNVYFTGGTITGVTISGLDTPLAIADGGTGHTTANTALNALLPTQSGQSGKTLKTDGTNTSWSSDTDTGITQLTGDVTAGPGSGSQAATVAKIAGVSVGTPTGTGNVVFSAAPTFTGTINAATLILSGSVTAASHIPTGSSVPTNGMYLAASGRVAISGASTKLVAFQQDTGGAVAVSAVAANNSASILIGAITVNNASSYTNGINIQGVAGSGTATALGSINGINMSAASLSGTDSATAWNGVNIGALSMGGSATLSSSIGVNVSNQGGAGVTNSYGVRVRAQSGSTNNFAILCDDGFSVKSTKDVIIGTVALATNATAGFPFVPSCAGTPTGSPTLPYTNAIPWIVDTSALKIWFLIGGTWRFAALT